MLSDSYLRILNTLYDFLHYHEVTGTVARIKILKVVVRLGIKRSQKHRKVLI